MVSLRVMTYNIEMGGRGGADLDRVVRAARPDVLLVNESPKAPVLGDRRCRRLAERWDLRVAGGGRAAGSNLVLVGEDVEVRRVRSRVLPQPRWQPRRGIVSVQLRVRGRLVGVVACHLSLAPDRRTTEAAEVLADAALLRGPLVVGGDLNEPPSGPAWALLRQAGLRDLGDRSWRTYPASAPRSRIDALLVRGAEVLSHGAPAGVEPALLARASDHLPVVADLAW
ncbi:endonuclease/exonuclease/phosphatase family protein [Alteromonas gracilis]